MASSSKTCKLTPLSLPESAAAFTEDLKRQETAMYNPIRGGTRGGQGDFTWAEVSADKDREVISALHLFEAYCKLTLSATELPWPLHQCTYWAMAEEQGHPLV
jgi:hypothetical protein